MEYTIAKGVFDILPKDAENWRESAYWQYIESVIQAIALEYGFREIRTPVFEKTELFTRSIGEGTDIVSKEMYTFQDKAGRSLTLRPEGTAPAMRAFIEKRLDQQSALHKFFYIGPMFRYERQQAGRYRQHHQFGVEAIGNSTPLQDVEIIDLLYSLFQRLGLKNLTLHLNSIGDKETRAHYREALLKYLHPYADELSEESKERMRVNPLRILDSKDPKDKKVLLEAPNILGFLNADSRRHFEQVCEHLTEIGIGYSINHNLVRGFDYYDSTVFEVTSDELGAQNSLGGGGRYDGLLKSLGGADWPAFGFGCGLERLIQTMLAQNVFFPPPPHALLYIIPVGEKAQKACFKLLADLRKQHLAVEMELGGRKLKASMRYADTVGARFVAVIGDNELETQEIQLKEMASGVARNVSLDSLGEILKNV